MVTVFRAGDLRVMIFMDDHELPHVFGDGQAKINLLGPAGAPEIVWSVGMPRSEARRALKLVAEQQAALLTRWRQIHG